MSSESETVNTVDTAASSYSAGTAALRATARWLLTAAAAVGGILVAGLQLTSIGALSVDDWPRLLGAIIGVCFSLAGVAFIIARISQLLTDDWITLTRLSLDQFQGELSGTRYLSGLFDELETHREELYGYVADDIPALYRALCDGNRRDRAAAGIGPDLAQDIAETRMAAHNVVEFANYYRTRQRFRLLGKQLLRGAIFVVLGVLLFSYSANPDKPDGPLHVVIQTR